MKHAIIIVIFFLSLGCGGISNSLEDQDSTSGPLKPGEPVKGWIILSDDLEEGLYVIDKAAEYDINHLQISHEIVHDLREIRDPEKLELTRTLTKKAHEQGIQEVVLWDHSLYGKDYYPERFRSGPDGTINLDNPEFWNWFKNDYREMLDLVPDIQGLVLTFIETGTRVERQYSEKLKTNQEKLAAVVNAIASVVIEERGLNLYTRTFSYTHEEYENVVGAIKLFENDKIRLMMKETPHDFFLTHPTDFFAGTIDRPTIIEFDVTGEFNGQGIIANTWPQHILDRWSDLLRRDHVIGYTARTDRYGDTRIVGRPSEINLLALKRYFEDSTITADVVYLEFIMEKYGEEAYPYIKSAFENAYDIITSVLYTLGTSTANHSSLNYDPYSSHYARHVSGKWFDPPVVFVEHDVNREFHYWKHVIDHIAPVWAKAGGAHLDEIPWVLGEGWIEPEEKMNEEYLNYILTEKNHGIQLAEESLEQIEQAKPYLEQEEYEQLHHYFQRTLLTAKLHKAVAAAYFGFRIYARGEKFRTPQVISTIAQGLEDIKEVSEVINNYPEPGPEGQWSWKEDTDRALQYHEWITQGTWPAKRNSRETSLGGVTFSEN